MITVALLEYIRNRDDNAYALLAQSRISAPSARMYSLAMQIVLLVLVEISPLRIITTREGEGRYGFNGERGRACPEC